MALAAAAFTTACSTTPEPPTQLLDPYEDQNRQMHALNKGIDRTLLRPVSNGYGNVVPSPVRQGVSNVADNLDAPADVINNILQFRLGQAAQTTLRFALNSTIGIAGLFDVATAMGIEENPTDFGETLYTWRVPEGSYTELPLLGPSTSRHALGRVVDFAMNPIRIIGTSPLNEVASVSGTGDVLQTRYQNRSAIDGVLYDSADSYEQARAIYIQNRRFELQRGSGSEEDYLDPYEDPYDFE